MILSEGTLTILGTSFLFLTIGHIQIWGSMLTYYLSYFRLLTDPTLTSSSLNMMPSL